MRSPFIKSLIVIFLIFVALATRADTNTLELSSFLPGGCYHAGEYQQHKTLAGMDKALITDGSFAFNCNQGLIWHTQSPITETIIYKAQGNQFVVRADGTTQALEGRAQRALGKILNNLIGGNSDYLRQTFSIAQKDDNVELTPKNKQMQKFLLSLSITKPHADSVKIILQLAQQETIAIRIFARRSFTTLEQTQCEQLPKLPPLACNMLFKGAH
jgi:hypothetical protein